MTRRTPDRTTYIREGREVGIVDRVADGWLAIIPGDVTPPSFVSRAQAERRIERELEAARV